jgi:DNA mismatch repair protein MutS
MVEMTETANIMRQATSNSLVLIDEIGRGTSTYDGMALAFACASWLANTIKSHTLFSTHYFELTQLPEQFSSIRNVHLQATLTNACIVFLYRVEEGPTNRSYGLEVAKLAGIPGDVLHIANQYLNHVQQPADTRPLVLTPDILPKESPILAELAKVDADNLSPRDALTLIYRLKNMEDAESIPQGCYE